MLSQFKLQVFKRYGHLDNVKCHLRLQLLLCCHDEHTTTPSSYASTITGQGRAGQGRARHGRAGQGRAGQGRAGQGAAGQGGAEQGNLAENEVWESQHYGDGVRKQQDNDPAPGEEGNLGHLAALPHGIHHFPAQASCSLPVGHAVRLCIQGRAEHAWGQGQGQRQGTSGQGQGKRQGTSDQGRAAHGHK